MASEGSAGGKSIVAITRGGREDAGRVIREGLDLIGGIHSIIKPGSVVLLKPNMGYPEPPGDPPWSCTTDALVLAALTELCLEAGARRVITGDSSVHSIRTSHMFRATGVQEAVEKAGGEICCFDEQPFVTRDVPGGVILKRQAIPRIVLDADVIVNIPKMKPTRMGVFTLGMKNLFGLVPHEERHPWHRMPEHYYLLVDLHKLVRPALTVMDGFVIKEGFGGARRGTPVVYGTVIMGKDAVATEAVTVQALGHEVYEQVVLGIAEKQGLGTADPNRIEVRGNSIESVRRYTKVEAREPAFNPSPQVVEYVGGACQGCVLGIKLTPYPWEIEPGKKYAVIFGQKPRLPEEFTEDEVIVAGDCAIMSKGRISKACRPGVTPRLIAGCPPSWHGLPGYMRYFGLDGLPMADKTNYVDE